MGSRMQQSQLQRTLRAVAKNRLTVVGVFLVLLVTAMAVFAPWIAPCDPAEIDPISRYTGPGRDFPFGSDALGRDVLSRVMYGTRVSLGVGVLSVFIGLMLGVAIGTFAALKGGLLDAMVIESANMLVALPSILLGIMILSIWGSGFFKLVITLAVAYLPRFIRLSRGLTLSIKEKEYIEASRAIGRSDFGIMLYHVIPNALSSNIVAGTLWISAAILAQAGLSFLGLGIAPPTPTWGGMIRDGVSVLMFAPWISVYPGIAIMITVIGFNMVGDGIRDLLDPRLTG